MGTLAALEARVGDARRQLDLARDARGLDHNVQTAIAVAIAQLRFDEARRALVRSDAL